MTNLPGGDPALGSDAAGAGHVAFLLATAGATSWYLYDVLSRARHVESTLLVGLFAPLTLVLVAIELARQTREIARRDPEPDARPASQSTRLVLLGLVTAFAGMIASLPWLGFDVGVVLYVAVSLLVQGDRRPLVLVYAVGLGLGIGWAVSHLLPYGAPALLF